MKNFEYLQPKSIAEAAGYLKAGNGTSIPYSGGTDALVMMKDNLISPKKVVNLKSIPGLNSIDYIRGEGLKIGALVTISDLAEHPVVKDKFKILSEAAESIASPQLRNVGTVGGNLCQRPRCAYFREDFDCLRKGGNACYAFDGENKLHCIIGGSLCYIVHPSDLATALLVLNTKISIASGEKINEIPIADFFVLPDEDFTRENILQSGEIVTSIFIPDLPEGTKSSYIKFRERAVWDFAVVSVGAVIQTSGSEIVSGRIAFGGVAPIPWTESVVNSKLINRTIDAHIADEIAESILSNADSLEMNGYKIPLAKNLTKRILTQLLM
jgi:xanthine dehydrogenase YagS FAD-binding subunit